MGLAKRKEAEMKPTPRSERMGIIADALMAARNFADKAQVPESVPLLGGQGLGSLLLGKAPEELNEISYGNMPIRVNPLAGRTASYVPEIKPGRKEQVADLAMLAGVPKVGKAGVGLAGVGDVSPDVEKALIAYHGTPHRFYRFDASKIGTGEGAQAYGYGLYFAESPGVAKTYQGGAAVQVHQRPKTGEWVGQAIDPSGLPLGKQVFKTQEEAKQFAQGIVDKYAKSGYLYTVDIPDKMINRMLDYDKPLSRQPKSVQQKLQTLVDSQFGKGTWSVWSKNNPDYRDLETNLFSDKTQAEVSELLRQSGIPGIRYLDASSRQGKEGTRNIVVFPGEEQNVKILKRNEEDAPKFAKGGMMKPTIPGFQEGGMNVDPVSGNEVPTGSLPEEVRDDVDAKLSPGEFVIPADVVRFIGLERLMKMRDEAKKGIQRMAEIGQMGNADEVGEESNSGYEDDGFESEIDDILGEVEREGNDEGVDKQMEMAFGGYVGSGTDLSKAPKNPVFDVRYYKGPNNQTMFITHINGKPMTPVPEGFKPVTAEEAQKVGMAADEEEAKKKAATTTTTEGYAATELDPKTAEWLDKEAATPGARDARMQRVNANLERITKGLPFVGTAKKVVDWAKENLSTGTPSAPLSEGTPGGMMSAAAADAYAEAKVAGATDLAATKAAQRTVEYIQSGYDPYSASQRAVDEAKQAEAVTKAAEESYMYGQPSPTTGATASPVSSKTIESRTLDLSGDSSMGAPGSTPGEGGIDDNWGMAKGGLVNKRQYPTKKKKGKGIAASKK